jgi:hypothetical protein
VLSSLSKLRLLDLSQCDNVADDTLAGKDLRRGNPTSEREMEERETTGYEPFDR